ncbi:Nucleotide-binding universal stress protein, UspA family [Bryocella elongata]|uniref:Nucleotide-binding universal stress protein, UspA family n=1 Tax=Bryocella elongata TaxID=863522 RepID=A0A1H5RZY6_9BACT|nr:universal stress protein [Bryocella elongata]SEF43922.1 Nucleotide-binding universal stress protein, UspA family [Bryocella elongata]
MPSTRKAAFSATKILLPLDFTATSETALEAATGLAKQFHAGIHLVHIVPQIPDFTGTDFFPATAVLVEQREVSEQKLRTIQERLARQGVATSFSIEMGNEVVGTLMRVLKEQEADMIVISTHGLSGWQPLILGSIAEHVIKQVDCTLLLLQSAHPVVPASEPTDGARIESFVPQSEQGNRITTGITASETPAQRHLNEVAGDLAEQGAQTEQRFDESHSQFTK